MSSVCTTPEGTGVRGAALLHARTDDLRDRGIAPVPHHTSLRLTASAASTSVTMPYPAT